MLSLFVITFRVDLVANMDQHLIITIVEIIRYIPLHSLCVLSSLVKDFISTENKVFMYCLNGRNMLFSNELLKQWGKMYKQ